MAEKTYREQWVAQGMAVSPAEIRASRFIAFFIIGAILLLAGERIAEALSNGRHNIIFTILIAFIGLIAAVKFIPLQRMTQLGKQFVASVITAHDVLSRPIDQGRNPQLGSVDPAMLGVSLLGIGILAGTPWSNFDQAFGCSRNSGSGCSTGSACGTSGDASSGGDSGGSGCGSGCGGGGD